MRALVLTTAALAAPLAAQSSPPDYLAFGELVDEHAEAVSSAGSCKHFGLTFDKDGLLGDQKRLVAEAVKDGIDARTAYSMIIASYERQSENNEAVNAAVDRSSEASVREYIDYWFARCKQIEASELGQRFVTYNPADDRMSGGR